MHQGIEWRQSHHLAIAFERVHGAEHTVYIFRPAMTVQGLNAGIHFDTTFTRAIDKIINDGAFHFQELRAGEEIILYGSVHISRLSATELARLTDMTQLRGTAERQYARQKGVVTRHAVVLTIVQFGELGQNSGTDRNVGRYFCQKSLRIVGFLPQHNSSCTRSVSASHAQRARLSAQALNMQTLVTGAGLGAGTRSAYRPHPRHQTAPLSGRESGCSASQAECQRPGHAESLIPAGRRCR